MVVYHGTQSCPAFWREGGLLADRPVFGEALQRIETRENSGVCAQHGLSGFLRGFDAAEKLDQFLVGTGAGI